MVGIVRILQGNNWCCGHFFIAGVDYEPTLVTDYFLPGHYLAVVVYIPIINDAEQEGEEKFTVELTAFDLSIILVNSVAEVVIEDDDGI